MKLVSKSSVLFEDLSAMDPDVETIRKSKNRADITRAAYAAHQTLAGIRDALKLPGASLQKTELKRQVQNAIKAVEELENAGDDDDISLSPAEEDSTTGELSESNAESLVAADAKTIMDSAGKISLDDASAVRSELRKLVETARRLKTEMASFSDKHGAAWSDAEAVENAARQVEEEGQHALLHPGEAGRGRTRRDEARPLSAAPYLQSTGGVHHPIRSDRCCAGTRPLRIFARQDTCLERCAPRSSAAPDFPGIGPTRGPLPSRSLTSPQLSPPFPAACSLSLPSSLLSRSLVADSLLSPPFPPPPPALSLSLSLFSLPHPWAP